MGDISITLNNEPMANGTSATWNVGVNTLIVTVTTEDDSETYTVTVTKE